MAKLSEQSQSLIPSPAHFVLEYGAEMRELAPRRGPRGVPNACCWTAYHLAARRKNLRYSEGFAVALTPVEHAWCIDQEGRVIDPTWVTNTRRITSEWRSISP